MRTRVATGRARVVRELRAAAPLAARLRAPVPARAPWLTAVLNGTAARPVAVVVEERLGGPPAGLAVLDVRTGPHVTATLLGSAVPAPPGRPPARLLARDDEAAGLLADGLLGLFAGLRRPWTLRLGGLPMGDPTLRALGRRRPDAAFGNARSSRLVDALDTLDRPVHRTRDPRELERRLPELLDREPDRRARPFLRAAARLHAAIGQLEVAVVPDGARTGALLLTLVDGADRQPWWGSSAIGGLTREMGAPVVDLTVATGWLSRPRAPR
ncbi:hypothetical protein [Blastococcus sp. SYSU D00820]